ncbi:hypothetical protein [Jannaschia marina]|uniref:hypothetical protein n=1 Tax=Jannaschia marina TaxID=2741674 RepID=UPI0015CEA6FD|nr:hypothetical protein [Jannaschia marina]
MQRALLAALLSTGLATQAAALSCLPASVPGSFRAANEAEAQYVLAVGRVQLLPGERVPEPAGDPNDRQGYSVKARFDGRLAGPEGFTQEAAFPVTVEVECAGAWCGGVPVDRVLAFIERRGEENVLVESPCPMFSLRATPEMVKQAEDCLAGENCEAPG